MPVAVRSVLPVIRPSPGKCLVVAATPPACIPSMNAATLSATFPDRCENSRYHCPIGSLAVPRASGTVSATGARLTFTPAPASCSAQRVASWVSSASGRPPWSIAEGISSKPAPCSCCTAPPSWSAAMNRPSPPGGGLGGEAGQVAGGRLDRCLSLAPATEQHHTAQVPVGDQVVETAAGGTCVQADPEQLSGLLRR